MDIKWVAKMHMMCGKEEVYMSVGNLSCLSREDMWAAYIYGYKMSGENSYEAWKGRSI